MDNPTPAQRRLPASAPVWPALRAAFGSVLDLLYPPRCLLCDRLGANCLCRGCMRNLLIPLPEPVCRRCGQPISHTRCGHCAERAPAFTRVVCCSQYAGGLRTAIHLLKYRDKPMLAEPLGRLLADFAREKPGFLNETAFDFVSPVPMHPIRRRLRGYNHAERLARSVAGELGLRLEARALARVRNTHPQVGFEREERLANLARAFAADAGICAGRTILVIDDVSTTGSTLHECAVALKSAGAKAVYGLTLAAG